MRHLKPLAFIIITFIWGCSQNNPDFIKLGKESMLKENYSLAKNQFSKLEPSDSSYSEAQNYISEIDSIESLILLKSIKKDSLSAVRNNKLRSKFSGSYKVEVSGISSNEEVEVYILTESGRAEWLWVYYKDNKVQVDDRKIGSWKASENAITIDIMGKSEKITEVFTLKSGKFINDLFKKRRLEKTNETFLN